MLTILKENGGECSRSKILEEIPNRIKLDDWALAVYPKTGYVCWKSMLAFFSIDLVYAEYITKQKGVVYLTPQGEEALSKGKDYLFNSAWLRMHRLC